MDSKKRDNVLPNPYLVDEVNPMLTDDEIKELMPAREYFAKYGGQHPVSPVPLENGKVMVTLDLDARVIAFFKAQGDDWWARLDKALLEMVDRADEAKKKAS